MLVVGDKEKDGGTVSVRQHKKGDLGQLKKEAFLAQMLNTIKTKSLTL